VILASQSNPGYLLGQQQQEHQASITLNGSDGSKSVIFTNPTTTTIVAAANQPQQQGTKLTTIRL
jgi:hypothetical protein